MGHHKVKAGMPQLQEKLTTHRPDLSGLSLGAKPNASAVSPAQAQTKGALNLAQRVLPQSLTSLQAVAHRARARFLWQEDRKNFF